MARAQITLLQLIRKVPTEVQSGSRERATLGQLHPRSQASSEGETREVRTKMTAAHLEEVLY